MLKNASMEEMAAYVCNELIKRDIEVVLSGGSCMEIYTDTLYSSYDIDLIMRYEQKKNAVRDIMLELGFSEDGKYFTFENNKNFIEFPSGPVAVGDEFIKVFNTKKTKFGELKLLTATDCIKDRLCACYIHNDKKCFEHALAVCHKNEINIENLKLWAMDEDITIQNGLDELLNQLDIINNPSDINLGKHLFFFCKEQILNITKDVDQKELQVELFNTYMGKCLFFGSSIDNLIKLHKLYEDIK